MLLPSLISSPFVVENIEGRSHNCCSPTKIFEGFDDLPKSDCRRDFEGFYILPKSDCRCRY